MNSDDIEDMLFNSFGDNVHSMAFVVFGAAGMTRAPFNLSNIDGTNGFALVDDTTDLGNGPAMGSAGDVNGDGLKDLVIGSYKANGNAGRAYILFARKVSTAGQWPSILNLASDLDGANGFTVDGVGFSQLGNTAVGAGDVNADGFADIFLGSIPGGAWVIFGHSAPWTSHLSVSQLNGTNGFHFASTESKNWGYSGGAAGDVNGDGVDDIIIGGYSVLSSTGLDMGAAAILFGHSGLWPAELDRNDAVGSIGFLIDGPSSNSEFGFSACGAGDVDGDGIADVVIGAPFHDLNKGYTVLVFGVPDDHCTVCSNTSDACLVCDDGFILNSTSCEAPLPPPASSSTSAQQGVSVVVIIKFIEAVTDPTELQEEIASVLGIDAGLVSVVVISPTEVEVTIIGSEETAQRLVDIINNSGAGSDGSGLGLLRKATDAHIRKDTNGSSDDDGVDAAPRIALPSCALFASVILAKAF